MEQQPIASTSNRSTRQGSLRKTVPLQLPDDPLVAIQDDKGNLHVKNLIFQSPMTKNSFSVKGLKMIKLNFESLRVTCLVCQFNQTNVPTQRFNPSTFRHAPTVAWAVDILPNMPKTKNHSKAILLAVDMFN